uniref:Uncharacterized protein n=1 Tax=Hucho hucho TaxID=62062 RepID=A0A4W5Q581_9TELE
MVTHFTKLPTNSSCADISSRGSLELGSECYPAVPPSAPPAEDHPSPGFSADDDASPLEPSPFHSALYMPQDELPVPPDIQLRQSGVPGVGGVLGIWAQRTLDVGERFGPYVGEQRVCLRDPTQGWEVGETLAVYCLNRGFSSLCSLLRREGWREESGS